jgi:transglutaminase-like putative cysteine protease
MRILTTVAIAAVTAGITLVTPACSRRSAETQSGGVVPLQAPPARPKSATPGPEQTPPPATPPTTDEIAALQERVEAVAHVVDSLPQLADLDAVGRSLQTPEAAFLFVRDQVANELYRGVQKGAWGALATRGGNDVDKALLLAALLKVQGVDVQLAHGMIDAATAQRLGAEPLAHPDAATLSLSAMKVPAAAVALDPQDQPIAAQFDQAVKRRAAAMSVAVDQAYSILAPSAPAAPPAPTPAADHYFVQASIDGKTVFFDPTLAANAPGASLVSAAAAVDPDSLPDDLFQRVRFTVVAAYLDAGKLTETTVLDKTALTADLIGKPVRFVVSTSGGASANDFRAQLLLNEDRTDGDTFHLHQQSGGDSGGGAGGLGGMFGGLGGGAPPASHTNGPPLARLWLDVSETAPDQQAFAVRRVILDRLNGPGTALASGQTDALARQLLLQVWDGAADAGEFVAPFVFRTQAAALKTVDTAAHVAYAAYEKHQTVEIGDLPGPVLSTSIVSLFFTSDLARHVIAHKLGQPVRSWYEMPRLAFLRRGARIADWQSPTPSAVYAEDTDLFEPLLGFSGPAPAVRELALRAGITDTALEAHTGSAAARPGTLAVFAAMPSGSSRHYTSASSLPNVPSGAVLRALKHDTASTAGVVAPSGFVSVGATPRFGWWAFAGGTPYALGKMELGGGQDLSEEKELQEVPKKIKPFIEFDGNITKCFIATAVSGLAGEEAQDQLTECMVSAVCDLIADLATEQVGEAAQEAVIDEEMIQELQTILKKIIAQDLKIVGAKNHLAKGCENKVGGALK